MGNRGYKELHLRVTKVNRDYRGLQGVQGVTRGYKGIQRVTRGYREYRGLQGDTEGYKGLQGVTKGYRGSDMLMLFLKWHRLCAFYRLGSSQSSAVVFEV